jgi:hypothetical protein
MKDKKGNKIILRLDTIDTAYAATGEIVIEYSSRGHIKIPVDNPNRAISKLFKLMRECQKFNG